MLCLSADQWVTDYVHVERTGLSTDSGIYIVATLSKVPLFFACFCLFRADCRSTIYHTIEDASASEQEILGQNGEGMFSRRIR